MIRGMWVIRKGIPEVGIRGLYTELMVCIDRDTTKRNSVSEESQRDEIYFIFRLRNT